MREKITFVNRLKSMSSLILNTYAMLKNLRSSNKKLTFKKLNENEKIVCPMIKFNYFYFLHFFVLIH